MYCVRCGQKGVRGEKRCSNCGMRLIEPELLLSLLKAVEGDSAKIDWDREKTGAKVPEKKESAPKVRVKAEKAPERVRTVSIFEDIPVKKKEKAKPEEEAKAPSARLPLIHNAKVESKPKSEKSHSKSQANRVVKLPEKSEKSEKPEKSRTEKTKKQAPKAERRAFRLGMDAKLPVRKKAPAEKEKSAKGSSSVRRDKSDFKSAFSKTPNTQKRANELSERRKNTVIPKRIKPRPQKRKSAHAVKDDTFFEKHARSIISMGLLAVTVVCILVWGLSTDSGRYSFAKMGFGSAAGYILMGDECMREGNYNRAVDYYHKSLSGKSSYEAASKLAAAYRETGNAEMEASALLLCIDRYPYEEDARERLIEMYPDPQMRPERVKKALE